MVNIGRDWMNSNMSTVNVVERPVAMNFYSKSFPGLGGAILFGNFNLGFDNFPFPSLSSLTATR